MAKYCISCGSALSPDDVFCGNCGERAPVEEKPPEAKRASSIPRSIPRVEEEDDEEGSTAVWTPGVPPAADSAPVNTVEGRSGFAENKRVDKVQGPVSDREPQTARNVPSRDMDASRSEFEFQRKEDEKPDRADEDECSQTTIVNEYFKFPQVKAERASVGDASSLPDSSDEDFADEEDYEPTLVSAREKYFLTRKSDGKKFELYFPCVVGRGSMCDVRILGDRTLSRKHARFSVKDDEVFIEDLSSTNSTLVDGETVSEGTKVKLKDDCSICLGDVDLTFTRELA